MDCKKCGALVPDGGTFCPNCGARADGKKNCNFCGNLIDESAVYCTYCGARVDGKKICKNCGEEIIGNFCTKCGYGVKEKTIAVTATPNKVKKEKPINDGTSISAFAKVEKVLSPSLSLLIMAVLFICSFFIGVTIKGNPLIKELLGIDSRPIGVFYYFSDAFNDVSIFMSNYSTNINSGLVSGLLKMVNIICLIIICINFVVQTVLAIVGGIKGGKAIYKKEQVDLNKYAIGMFISFIATAVIIYATNYVSLKAISSISVVEVATKMSFGSIFGIVFSIILFVGVFVLMQIKKGKGFASPHNLKFIITLAVSIILSGITILLIEKIGVRMVGLEGDTQVSISVGTSMVMEFILESILTMEDPAVLALPCYLSIASYLVSIACIIFAVATLAYLTYSIFSGNQKKVRSIILSSITLLLSIVCAILLNLTIKEYMAVYSMNDGYELSAIPCIIFAALSLASVIVYSALNKKKQIEKENLDIELE